MPTGASEKYTRRSVLEIHAFAKEWLHLDMLYYKIKIVCLPRPVDILGLCANGGELWLRKAVIKKAKNNLNKKQAALSLSLLDVTCSYYGLGIV